MWQVSAQETEVARLEASKAAEVAKLEESQAAELAKLQEAKAGQLSKLQESTAAELLKVEQSKAAELAKEREAAHAQLSKLQDEKQAELAKLQVSQLHARADNDMGQPTLVLTWVVHGLFRHAGNLTELALHCSRVSAHVIWLGLTERVVGARAPKRLRSQGWKGT